MKTALLLVIGLLAAAALAFSSAPSPLAPPSPPAPLPPPPAPSVFASGRTAYGFFPSPPLPTYESVLETFQAMGEHGDVVLIQQNIPWDEFIEDSEGESQ